MKYNALRASALALARIYNKKVETNFLQTYAVTIQQQIMVSVFNGEIILRLTNNLSHISDGQFNFTGKQRK